MSWRQFFAAIIQTLAWPLTVLIVVLSFRRKINVLLGDRLKSLKAGPVEAEWADQIGLAQEAVRSERAANEDLTPDDAQAEPETEGDDEQTSPSDPERSGLEPVTVPSDNPEKNPVPSQLNRDKGEGKPSGNHRADPEEGGFPSVALQKVSPRRHAKDLVEASRKIAKNDPTAAVRMGSKALDIALDFVSEQSYGELIEQRKSSGALAKDLVDEGVVGPGTYDAITRLMHLRNSVMHGRPDISLIDALLYLNTLDEVLGTLLHPAELYESQVAAALGRLAFEVSRGGGGGADFVVPVGPGAVAVFTKCIAGRLLTRRDIEEAVGKNASNRPSAIVVTNADLSPSARSVNQHAYQIAGCRVEAVTWKSRTDDGLLARAMSRAAVAV